MRKAALALTLTLLLTLSTTPTLLNTNTFGSSPHATGLGYVPTATDFIYPVGNPRIAPTFGAVGANGYQITQMFNNSCDPALGQGYYYAGQYFCGHTGVDLSNRQEGGTVVATANGLVVFSGYSSSFGEMVRIQHLLPDGSYVYSQYEHLMYGSVLVSYGQVVSMGQAIGQVGSTGFVTGAHLHFEIKAVNEDGVGYTFGNAALIQGYYEPISFIAAHTAQLLPTATPVPPTAVPPVVSAAAPTTDTDNTAASNGGEQKAVLADFYSHYQDYVTVTADHVNVRAGSGFNFAPLNSVNQGAKLGFLGLTGDGWVHVALPSNVYGYMARQFVDGTVLPQLPPIEVSTPLNPPFVEVQDTRYPARSGPEMHDMAIEPLWVGEKLTYLGTLGSWDKVALPSGRVGWVLNWYLSYPAVYKDLSATQQVPVSAGTGASAAPRSVAAKPSVAATQPATTPPSDQVAGVKPPQATGPVVVTTVDGLRLRKGPRLAAPVIEGLAEGTKLALLGYHTSWDAVIAPDGAQGYVLGRFVQLAGTAGTSATSTTPAAPHTTSAAPHTASSASSPTPAAHPATTADHGAARAVDAAPAAGFVAPYLYVNVAGANVRAGPSTKERVLVSEPRDTKLALHGSSGDWVNVETRDGVVGWIRRDLVRAGATV